MSSFTFGGSKKRRVTLTIEVQIDPANAPRFAADLTKIVGGLTEKQISCLAKLADDPILKDLALQELESRFSQ